MDFINKKKMRLNFNSKKLAFSRQNDYFGSKQFSQKKFNVLLNYRHLGIYLAYFSPNFIHKAVSPFFIPHSS